MTQPQKQFDELGGTTPTSRWTRRPGPVWEHWGFNILNVHLAKAEVREAIAHALNKAR